MAQGDIGNVVDLIDIERIQDSTVILKSGGLRQVVMVGGTNFSLKSEADQNVLTAAYQNFLNSLNFSLQIIIHSRKINIEAYLKTLEDRKNQEVSPILQNQIGEYQAFVRSFVAENPIMVKTFLVVVPYSAPVVPKTSGLMSFLPFGNKQAAAEKAGEERERELHESITQLRQRSTQITEGLTAMGLETTILGDEALVELFYNFYNPETIERTDIKVKTETPKQ